MDVFDYPHDRCPGWDKDFQCSHISNTPVAPAIIRNCCDESLAMSMFIERRGLSKTDRVNVALAPNLSSAADIPKRVTQEKRADHANAVR